MNRRLTNMARFIMDECLPPIIRDSRWFMFPFYCFAYRFRGVGKAMSFKSLVHSWTPEQYREFYRSLDTISKNRETDLNRRCLDAILDGIPPRARNVIDVGCGNGFLLRKIKERYPHLELCGVDLAPPPLAGEFTYLNAEPHKLPFPNKSFDVVVCTHTLEHLLDLTGAVAELKRLASDRLFVVTPCQRSFYYTLDEHLNFFLYREQLTSLFNLKNHTCDKLFGDWFYHAQIG